VASHYSWQTAQSRAKERATNDYEQLWSWMFRWVVSGQFMQKIICIKPVIMLSRLACHYYNWKKGEESKPEAPERKAILWKAKRQMPFYIFFNYYINMYMYQSLKSLKLHLISIKVVTTIFSVSSLVITNYLSFLKHKLYNLESKLFFKNFSSWIIWVPT